MARMGHVVGICLMAALAVALCASFTVAEHINAPTDTVFVESAATVHKEGWFHLDDLLQGTAIDEQKQTATKLPRFREMAPQQESSESGGSSEDSSDDPDKSEEEKSKIIKHKKGGSTTVVKNRNFMSLTEDAKGNELDPAAAAAEARLEAQEQYMKRTAEDSKKRNKEAKVKHGKRSADEQSEKDKKKAAEASKKSAVEEVRKAQEGTNKVNNKRREQYTKRRAMEQKLKKESNVRLSKEWKHYGYGYAPAMANVSGSRCMVSGLIRGRRGFIGYLPNNCRPGGRIMFSQANGNGLARIDILADGRMYFITGPQQHWISLTGMDFATSGNVDITLKSNWQPYGSSWRKPGVRIESGVCMVSGLVRSGAWSTIASLPDNCRSNERLIFRVCNHRWISRLDIIGNEIRWVGGTKNHGWVALDGISFAPGVGGGSLKLYNNWTNYGSGYRPARIYVNQNVCHVSGLIRNLVDPNFTRKRHITTLPSNCRPKARLIFSTLSSHARLDILPNGSVIYINGKSSKVNWLSLSGIKFYTA